jgi:hypothetical protein
MRSSCPKYAVLFLLLLTIRSLKPPRVEPKIITLKFLFGSNQSGYCTSFPILGNWAQPVTVDAMKVYMLWRISRSRA